MFKKIRTGKAQKVVIRKQTDITMTNNNKQRHKDKHQYKK